MRYYFEGFSISKNGRSLATLYRNYMNNTFDGPHRYELTVYDIPERSNSSDLSRAWCTVAVSLSFESHFIGICAQPLVFESDDTLHCLCNRIKIGTNVQGKPFYELSPVSQANFGSLGELRAFGYSNDCQSLIVYHDHKKSLMRLRVKNMSLDSAITLTASSAMAYCISHTGRYVVWRDTTVTSRIFFLQDLVTEKSEPLFGSEHLAFPANLNLIFSKDEECLLGIMSTSATSDRSPSYIAIWDSFSQAVRQTCSQQLPRVHGVHFSSRRDPAYLAVGDRWLTVDPMRLDLLVGNVKQIHERSSVKCQVSQDGTQVSILSVGPKRWVYSKTVWSSG